VWGGREVRLAEGAGVVWWQFEMRPEGEVKALGSALVRAAGGRGEGEAEEPGGR
jgi:hypothetical protein